MQHYINFCNNVLTECNLLSGIDSLHTLYLNTLYTHKYLPESRYLLGKKRSVICYYIITTEERWGRTYRGEPNTCCSFVLFVVAHNQSFSFYIRGVQSPCCCEAVLAYRRHHWCYWVQNASKWLPQIKMNSTVMFITATSFFHSVIAQWRPWAWTLS